MRKLGKVNWDRRNMFLFSVAIQIKVHFWIYKWAVCVWSHSPIFWSNHSLYIRCSAKKIDLFFWIWIKKWKQNKTKLTSCLCLSTYLLRSPRNPEILCVEWCKQPCICVWWLLWGQFAELRALVRCLVSGHTWGVELWAGWEQKKCGKGYMPVGFMSQLLKRIFWHSWK